MRSLSLDTSSGELLRPGHRMVDNLPRPPDASGKSHLSKSCLLSLLCALHLLSYLAGGTLQSKSTTVHLSTLSARTSLAQNTARPEPVEGQPALVPFGKLRINSAHHERLEVRHFRTMTRGERSPGTARQLARAAAGRTCWASPLARAALISLTSSWADSAVSSTATRAPGP